MKRLVPPLLCVLLLVTFFVLSKTSDITSSYSKFSYIIQQGSAEETLQYDAEKEKAQNADVLILGDQLALSLNPWLGKYIDTISVRLKEPLKVYNWGKTNEGLHRSFAKLLTLEKLPSIIIYFGGISEFFENTIPQEKDQNVSAPTNRKEETFRSELDCYSGTWVSSLNIVSPKLAAILCQRSEKTLLPFSIVEDKRFLTSTQMQSRIELQYKLFESQTQDLKSFVDEHNISLVLITAPINYSLEPKRVCENTTSSELEEIQKESVFTSEELIEISPSNAKSHYLAANLAFKEGNYERAINEWELSRAFDCDLKGASSPIFNNILLQKKSQRVHLIDFQSMIYTDLKSNGKGPAALFKDKQYPLDKYYDRLTFEIVQITKSIYEL